MKWAGLVRDLSIMMERSYRTSKIELPIEYTVEN